MNIQTPKSPPNKATQVRLAQNILSALLVLGFCVLLGFLGYFYSAHNKTQVALSILESAQIASDAKMAALGDQMHAKTAAVNASSSPNVSHSPDANLSALILLAQRLQEAGYLDEVERVLLHMQTITQDNALQHALNQDIEALARMHAQKDRWQSHFLAFYKALKSHPPLHNADTATALVLTELMHSMLHFGDHRTQGVYLDATLRAWEKANAPINLGSLQTAQATFVTPSAPLVSYQLIHTTDPL